MADYSHLKKLQRGVEAWNSWRKRNPSIEPDLSGADLTKVNLSGTNLSKSNLSGANLTRADFYGSNLSEANLRRANLTDAKFLGGGSPLGTISLYKANLFEANLRRASLGRAHLRDANLSKANLRDANLSGANLSGANLSRADLTRAYLYQAKIDYAHLPEATFFVANLSEVNLARTNLYRANLYRANLLQANLTRTDLSEANLREANLSRAYLFEANLSGAKLSDANLTHSVWLRSNLTGTALTGCSIYGISAWSLNLEGTRQQNLNISDEKEPVIMVDNLEVAQFVYLLLNNEKIRDVIDTIGEKGVLILGRFTEERKRVLDAIRERLRELGFVPMMFDFERPTQRDFTETIKTLAGLSRFIVVDITNPRSSPLELQATMPDYMVPFIPIIHEDEEPFAMFRDLKQKYGEWVLDVLEYDSADSLLGVLDEAVVRSALAKADQLMLKKAEAIRKRHVKDYQ